MEKEGFENHKLGEYHIPWVCGSTQKGENQSRDKKHEEVSCYRDDTGENTSKAREQGLWLTERARALQYRSTNITASPSQLPLLVYLQFPDL